MNEAILRLFFGFIISFLITRYLVSPLCAIAFKINFLDRPDGIIKKHENSIPCMGGLAIFIGFLISAILVLPGDHAIFLLLIGLTFLLLVGLVDDLIILQPYQKFFGQLLGTLCFLKSGFYLKSQFFSNNFWVVISGFWFLAVINAMNLVDIMDGLAGTIALGALASFFLIALLLHNTLVILLIGCMGGSLLAFLSYNWPPARIYLGDAGALFLGGFLASLPFLLPWSDKHPYFFMTSIIILAIPLAELTSLIIIRTYKGIPFYKGSLDHFAHYLLRYGWGKRSILLTVMAVSVLLSALTYLIFKSL